jgi:hypothetical protein
MRRGGRGVFSKNICEGVKERASERRNENIIVSGILKRELIEF